MKGLLRDQGGKAECFCPELAKRYSALHFLFVIAPGREIKEEESKPVNNHKQQITNHKLPLLTSPR